MTMMMKETSCRTLGELVSKNYPGFEVFGGSAPDDMDITHGVEIKVSDNSKYGYGISVSIYPCIEWSDGSFRPCHYWGSKYYLMLFKQ